MVILQVLHQMSLFFFGVLPMSEVSVFLPRQVCRILRHYGCMITVNVKIFVILAKVWSVNPMM